MEQKEQYLEKACHGTVMFPVEYYYCEYPVGLAGLPVHWHEEFELTCMRKGRCTYLINLEPCQVEAGDFLFLPTGMLHGIPEGKTGLAVTDSFVFHPEIFGSSAKDACIAKYIRPLERGETGFSPVIRRDTEAARRAGEYFQILMREFAEKKPGYELAVKAALFSLMALFCREVPSWRKRPENQEVLEKLKIVLQYMKENYARPIAVAELADCCHFSEYYFMRFFKEHINMTCVEYLNQYRMEIASGKLEKSQESITEIAMECGFQNISYFNRVFRKRFGMTPREYRKKVQTQKHLDIVE